MVWDTWRYDIACMKFTTDVHIMGKLLALAVRRPHGYAPIYSKAAIFVLHTNTLQARPSKEELSKF